MSGGVDSTVVARLLLDQGHNVHGFFMLLPLEDIEEKTEKVHNVADRLHIPLHCIDLRKDFSRAVISPFVDSYHQGLTPNPCVVCNETIKCGQLLDVIIEQGMKHVATGHYARILRHADGSALHRGIDPGKDQSYFLCRLKANQLARLLFPLGELHKTDVYKLAATMGFSHFDGQESQDVCFLSQHTLPDFLLSQGMANTPGDIVTSDGKILGRHRGIWQYTVGQRRGLGLPDATPWYVTALNPAQNQVIIGKNSDLFRHRVLLDAVRWIIPKPAHWQGRVQLRSRHQAAAAKIFSLSQGQWQVEFAEPQRAITPGQFAVFYTEDQVVGSGIIQPGISSSLQDETLRKENSP